MSDAAIIPMPAKKAAAPLNERYELGEIPPLGHLPPKMYGWAIRRERHGPPNEAMQVEVLPTPQPEADEVIAPIISVVPLQLFAYYIGIAKGYDVDKPRNLAKSVTVE